MRTSLAVKGFREKYGVSQSIAYKYFALAEKEITAYQKNDRHRNAAKAANRMLHIYRTAVNQGDLLTAIKAAQHHDDVAGLTAKDMNVKLDIGNDTDSVRLEILRKVAGIKATGGTGAPSSESGPSGA
jgi:hypothetical protein